MGDLVITLPYIRAIAQQFPKARIDLLTREEVAEIPQRLSWLNRVHIIRGGRNLKLQFLYALVLLPRLLTSRYQIVIDLQNNRLSRAVLSVLRPNAWTLFDRFSPLPAGERTRATIEKIGLQLAQTRFDVRLCASQHEQDLLISTGWKRGAPLVVLNPAGFFMSRNWPLENYAEFAALWLERFDAAAQFVVLGVDRLCDKAAWLEQQLGERLINLVGRTSADEAFAIIGQAVLVISEDSGLMHMAWISGVPTIALFGSSRSDWSRPLGPHSICLDSSDLECGCCMSANCRFGDNRCLTRYSPEFVATTARNLLTRMNVH